MKKYIEEKTRELITELDSETDGSQKDIRKRQIELLKGYSDIEIEIPQGLDQDQKKEIEDQACQDILSGSITPRTLSSREYKRFTIF